MIYLGIDPGVRTGICELVVSVTGKVYIEDWWDVPGGADGFIDWWNHSAYHYPDLIIFEGFTLREGKNGVDITPRDVIGALKALADRDGIGALKALADRDGIPLVERPPSGRKKQVSDLILKRLGLYLPGEPNRNAREAVRHVVAYLKAQKNPTVLEAFK